MMLWKNSLHGLKFITLLVRKGSRKAIVSKKSAIKLNSLVNIFNQSEVSQNFMLLKRRGVHQAEKHRLVTSL